jgi:hypothetical protein
MSLFSSPVSRASRERIVSIIKLSSRAISWLARISIFCLAWSLKPDSAGVCVYGKIKEKRSGEKRKCHQEKQEG